MLNEIKEILQRRENGKRLHSTMQEFNEGIIVNHVYNVCQDSFSEAVDAWALDEAVRYEKVKA